MVKLAVLTRTTRRASALHPRQLEGDGRRYGASYALLNELLFESEFTDTALIASNIALFPPDDEAVL